MSLSQMRKGRVTFTKGPRCRDPVHMLDSVPPRCPEGRGQRTEGWASHLPDPSFLRSTHGLMSPKMEISRDLLGHPQHQVTSWRVPAE
jgi:hypothetical protein